MSLDLLITSILNNNINNNEPEWQKDISLTPAGNEIKCWYPKYVNCIKLKKILFSILGHSKYLGEMLSTGDIHKNSRLKCLGISQVNRVGE